MILWPPARRSAEPIGASCGASAPPETVEWEFIDIFRVQDGRLIEHWTSMDMEALRTQMRPGQA